MEFTMRFYWQTDLDLIGLYVNPDFNLAGKMKEAVVAYARGLPFTIRPPEPPKSQKRETLDSCSIHLRFDEIEEHDVIDAIHTFRSGHINATLKVIFRSYLEYPYLYPFYTDSIYQVKTRVKGTRKKKTGAAEQGGKVIPKRVLPAAKTKADNAGAAAGSSKTAAGTPAAVRPETVAAEEKKSYRPDNHDGTKTNVHSSNDTPGTVKKEERAPSAAPDKRPERPDDLFSMIRNAQW